MPRASTRKARRTRNGSSRGIAHGSARRATTRPGKRGRASPRTAPRARTRPAKSAAAPKGSGIRSNVTPCLWFDKQAEEAARFYVGLFQDSRIVDVHRAAADYPSGSKGDVLTVEFTLMGRPFTALNGGPYFRFNEAVSLQIPCKDQAEVDRYWKALSAVPASEQCGWVKDRYGLSWQVVPTRLYDLLNDPDAAKAQRVMEAMLGMKKLDVAGLERAARAK